MLRPLLAGMLAVWFSFSALAHAEEGEWDFLIKKDDIYVWKRERAEGEMPGFRGRVYVNATPEAVLDEMLDYKNHPEWMYACSESKLLKRLSDEHAIMYNRIDAPWPLWDRDVIVDTYIQRRPDTIVVRFQNIESSLKKVPRRVVRLPRLEGYYKLQKVAPNKTKIVYEAVTDIGGSIPRWAAIRGAAALPYETLSRLKERVED